MGKLTDCIRSAGGSTLRDVRFFDVYTGAGIPQGKKSVAFSLTLRSDDATLTDEHAEETVQAILAALRDRLDARYPVIFAPGLIIFPRPAMV